MSWTGAPAIAKKLELPKTELVNAEIQKQAADQVSISNSITSLRFLGTNDWKEFVEDRSTIEHILRQDPNGVYGKMDFFEDEPLYIFQKVKPLPSL